MSSGARRRQRMEATSSSGQASAPHGAAHAHARASSAPPATGVHDDDLAPPLKNRMLHIVEVRERAAAEQARRAAEAAAAPAACPKSLGAARSKAKAVSFDKGHASAAASSSPQDPAAAASSGTHALVRMTRTAPPQEPAVTTESIEVDALGTEHSLKYDTVVTNELHDVLGIGDHHIVLLSFFDGIGAAHVALANLGVKPCFTMSFENDEECKSVLRAHFPDVEIINSYDVYTATELMDCVQKVAQHERLVVLVTAGPPCPDFSRIKGSTSKGRSGPEGQKFVKFVELLHHLRSAAESRRWGFHFVVENVIMTEHEAQYFNAQLGVQAFVMDAGDMTCVSRPRMWWTSFLNAEESALRMAKKDIPALKWLTGGKEGAVLVKLPIATVDPKSLEHGDVHCVSVDQPGQKHPHVASAGPLRLHESVRTGNKKVPTFTTPAPNEGGRDAPEGSLLRCSEGAKQRWQADLRRFAPWQYEPHAMMTAATGHCFNMPATVKEVLMGFPARFTHTGKDDAKNDVTIAPTSRHRMLANTWHVGVAQAVLYMFLVLALVPSTKAATLVPAQPRLTCLHRISAWCSATPGLWRSCAADVRMGHHRTVQEDSCAHAHLAAALGVRHPALADSDLPPAAALAVWMYVTIGPDIIRWRRDVLDEIAILVDDLVPDWAASLPAHIREAYSGKGSRPLAAPVIRVLLDAMGYPGASVLEHELTVGFPAIGPMPRGTGWPLRDTPKPPCPLDRPSFLVENCAYIRHNARARPPDKHAERLLAEVWDERERGRVRGPFQAHPSWGFIAVSPRNPATGIAPSPLPIPHGDCAASFAFGIEQLDPSGALVKVRRGEDWRRSHHNRATIVRDRPRHDTVDAFVQGARFLANRQGAIGPVHLWGHDHEGAYRQLPTAEPELSYMLLITEEGVSVWQHVVLVFGATSSVWGYNRFGDALVTIGRLALATLCFHYVDDYGGVEYALTAASAFDGFERLNASLGAVMKPAKAQPPAPEHVIQGVLIRIEGHQAIVCPTPERKARLSAQCEHILATNRLSPQSAGVLAGKFGFVASTLYGQIARPVLHALYGRQCAGGANVERFKLTSSLRASLTFLLQVLTWAPPRQVHFRAVRRSGIAYADAFFEMDGARHRPCDSPLLSWNAASSVSLPNGWGVVARCPVTELTWYAFGVVPENVLKRFAKRRQYIFLLETLAQCIASWLFYYELGEWYLSFVDNTASQYALTKGYSRDAEANTIVGLFWTFAALRGVHPWFERVGTHAQLADAVSRGDVDVAERLRWKRVDADLTEVWGVIATAVENDCVASRDAAAAVLRAVNAVRESNALPVCASGIGTYPRPP